MLKAKAPGKANCGGGSLSIATTRTVSRSENGRADGAGLADHRIAENSSQERREQVVEVEPGAAGVFANMQQAEHCVEGAAAGDYDVRCGEIFLASDYASRNADGAGGAQPGISGGNFQYCATLLGEPAQGDAEGRAGEVALECPPNCVSTSR